MGCTRLCTYVAGCTQYYKKIHWPSTSYNIFASAQPSADDWLTHVTQPAVKGGMGAEVIPTLAAFMPCVTKPPPVWDINHEAWARHALTKIRQLLVHAPRRRSCPNWSLPVELFVMIMAPSFSSDKNKGRRGNTSLPAGGDAPTFVRAQENHAHGLLTNPNPTDNSEGVSDNIPSTKDLAHVFELEPTFGLGYRATTS